MGNVGTSTDMFVSAEEIFQIFFLLLTVSPSVLQENSEGEGLSLLDKGDGSKFPLCAPELVIKL